MRGNQEKEEEFFDFYKTNLAPVISDLTKKSSQCIGLVGIASGVVLVILLPALLYTLKNRSSSLLFYSALIGAAITAAIIFVVRRSFCLKFKREVIGRIARFISAEISYEPTGKIHQHEFKNSMLFRSFNQYNGEDHFTGKFGATSFKASELTVRRRVNNKHTISVFKGLFFVADFNKHFKGFTLVFPDNAERVLGWVGKKLQSWDFTIPGDLIYLEDGAFESHFAVYASNKIEARYILSPELMQRIVAFKRKVNSNLYLAFVDSKMYLALSTDNDCFEPETVNPTANRWLCWQYYNDILFFKEIIDDMNLNNRIWTKE